MPKKREIYSVAYESDLTRFLNSVKGYLNDGWVCQGGISTYYDMQQHHVVFAQAFLKKETYNVDDED